MWENKNVKIKNWLIKKIKSKDKKWKLILDFQFKIDKRKKDKNNYSKNKRIKNFFLERIKKK